MRLRLASFCEARFRRKNGSVAVSTIKYALPCSRTACLRARPELISRVRSPYDNRLQEKLAVTEGLLYRRGNPTAASIN
jgi:sulfur-oxidizing protein SoxB